MNLLSLSEKVVKLSEKLGANECEVYISSANGNGITFTNKIEAMSSFTSTGLGIRLIFDKHIGFYSSSLLTSDSVEEGLKTALAMAKVSKEDPEWVSLPTRLGKSPVRNVFDRKIEAMDSNTLVDTSISIIDEICDYDKRLATNRSGLRAGTVETVVSNSSNRPQGRKETFASISLSVKAEESGKKGMSNESCVARSWKEIELELPALIRSTAERALKVMDAKSVPSGKMAVVWRNTVFARILGVMFGGTLTADSIQNKRSPWSGKLEKQITSPSINLFDDGLREGGIGTREFDDEGIPQQMTPLISEGVLKNYLYDNYTANKDKVSSTGNAHRFYGSFPMPSPNNLSLKPTKIKAEELIKDTKRGLYVADTIGEWLSNPISGDLSATIVNGFLIESGELTQPIKDVIVSGNFFAIMNDSFPLIADDVKNSGAIYSPSVRFTTMIVTENK